MQNPFETGHIKNYMLFYAGVIIIMILFFTASMLFHDIKKVEKKSFINKNTNTGKTLYQRKTTQKKEKKSNNFKLLDKSY